MQGKQWFGRKMDFIDPSKLLALFPSPSPSSLLLLPLVLSDLLTYASHAHQMPGIAKVVHDSMASRLPMIPVDFVPFGLSCQALAVRMYRAYLQRDNVDSLPVSMHAELLKVWEGCKGRGF